MYECSWLGVSTKNVEGEGKTPPDECNDSASPRNGIELADGIRPVKLEL